jgi:predicted Fe-Mo cluster-binding NifX family protein
MKVREEKLPWLLLKPAPSRLKEAGLILIMTGIIAESAIFSLQYRKLSPQPKSAHFASLKILKNLQQPEMKTAIAAQSVTNDSLIDKHFGKCSHFFIYDDKTNKTEVIPNPASGVQGCKGEVIVNELVKNDVNRVVAGDFGTIVQQLLNKHHIQMIIHPANKTGVSEIIQLLTYKITP